MSLYAFACGLHCSYALQVATACHTLIAHTNMMLTSVCIHAYEMLTYTMVCTNRRALIREVETPVLSSSQTDSVDQALSRNTVHATVPLRELVGYASTLRAISAGDASFTMRLQGYSAMDALTTRQVLKDGY
jgi:translation elongation factor EF-G